MRGAVYIQSFRVLGVEARCVFIVRWEDFFSFPE